MLLCPFDHGDQASLTLTEEVVRCWFVCSEREICNKDFKVLGFLKEFDILTVLWPDFFSLFLLPHLCEKKVII